MAGRVGLQRRRYLWNFPADTDLDALIGLPGSEGADGDAVGSTKSDSNGDVSATFTIPEKFHGEPSLVIRLEGGSGYHAYNTFSNQ